MYDSTLLIYTNLGAVQSMYQREAMWIDFTNYSDEEYAVKVSAGGINALTGMPQDVPVPGKQDYLAVKTIGGQL